LARGFAELKYRRVNAAMGVADAQRKYSGHGRSPDARPEANPEANPEGPAIKGRLRS